jgi:UDP-N-acetyl-D-mannosaminuronic acid transferase (WecB/TagA/CpsF family)
MKFHTGGVSFDTAADRRWTVPVARIGGLPVAVIDRALSAELTVDVAPARRNPAQPPLIFTSANGQVLSMCARQAQTRELFLNADLIHAVGMPLVFVSRFFHKTPVPERVCTTDLFHDVVHVARRRGGLRSASSSASAHSCRRGNRTSRRRWAYRMYLDPRRLSGRYLATNPHALFLLLTRTSLTSELTPQAGEQSVQ